MSVGYGRILVVSSIQSQVASPNYLPYTASKWSLMAMQEEFYSTRAASGQTSNLDFVTIMPGTITTSLGYSATYGELKSKSSCHHNTTCLDLIMTVYTCGAFFEHHVVDKDIFEDDSSWLGTNIC